MSELGVGADTQLAAVQSRWHLYAEPPTQDQNEQS
jgi:hypothetical protein